MNSPQTSEMASPDIDELMSLLNRLLENVATVVLGKPEVIKLAVVALLAEGHVLIEDVPGVGKTLLARALAASIDCSFRRVQFTPDLLPSDIIGSSVYNAASGEFVFKPGPIFANVILADEINRTTPRTQSALLEAMSDTQVSVEGKTYTLEPPFIVLATQNPYEFEGTYVLPESQLDRFMIRLRMGYPVRSEERRVLPPIGQGNRSKHSAQSSWRKTFSTSNARCGMCGSTTQSPNICSISFMRPARERTFTLESAPEAR